MGRLFLRGALGAVDLLFPNLCVACQHPLRGQSPREVLCTGCRGAIERLAAKPYCGRCGRSGPLSAIHSDGCAGCQREHHWNLRGIVRVGGYSEPLRSLVLGLKYGGDRRNAEAMGTLLSRMLRICGWGQQIEALIPVPMHWKRRLQRPCDHAALLATDVGRRLRVPVTLAVCRARYARSQTELTVRAQRFENVADCFRPAWLAVYMHNRTSGVRTGPRDRPDQGTAFLSKPAQWAQLSLLRSVSGKTVCIIDNLMTSGATLHEVAKEARRAGAKAVYAAIVTRSDPERDEPRAESEELGESGTLQ